MRPCFAFKNLASADDTPAVLSIYDEIGFWGVQAKDFIKDLGAVKSAVLNVEINSPGGDVFAGLAIYNALKGSGKEIVVKVMGVAASAASLIAMAGDKIVMPKNTFMMVHNPWSFAMGNAEELRQQADVLDKIGSSLLATYVARTGKPEDEIAPLLAKDTWLTADEALALGFATEVVSDITANARFDMARAELPEAVKAVFALTAPADPAAAAPVPAVNVALADQIEARAKAADMGGYAAMWAVTCDSLAQVDSRIADAREIVALCAVAKNPAMADASIRAGMPVSAVRAALVQALAEHDADTHTSTARSTTNEQPTGDAKPATTAALWASHTNGRKERTKK